MKPQVVLARCQDYEQKRVEESVDRILVPLGGIGTFVHPEDTVLIKPNLLAPKASATAVNTHPVVVGAILKAVIRAGGRPFIGDSPGLGNARKNAERCGLEKVAADLNVPIVEFKESVPIGKIREGGFPLELSGEALRADVIINVPKFKTHGQMLLTLGVKNMFGCVVGKRKAQWHLKAGVNRDAFASMVVQICAALSPDLTLIDGIVGMEGNGPGSGTPRNMGILAASRDPVALDTVMMDLIGIDPFRLATLRAAKESGIGETDLDRIEIQGEKIERLRIRDLKIPDSSDLEWTLPDFLMGILKDSISAYPEPDPKMCQLCHVCIKACPQRVIEARGSRLKIDTRHCIRCFCCQELCPHGAMKTRQGWLLRLLRKR
jgi:uncharacterized protein (DUF362 family)/Pyruvate/2-oxoacid:ferredoxin oxidoreductase delta subunit